MNLRRLTQLAADTVAANALHGALLIGERHAFAPRTDAWRRELAGFTAQLYCNDRLIDSGGGAAVLGAALGAQPPLPERSGAVGAVVSVLTHVATPAGVQILDQAGRVVLLFGR